MQSISNISRDLLYLYAIQTYRIPPPTLLFFIFFKHQAKGLFQLL